MDYLREEDVRVAGDEVETVDVEGWKAAALNSTPESVANVKVGHAVLLLPMGAQGARLRQIAILGGSIHSMARVVDWLRQNLGQPLRIESIAQELGKSVSGLYHQFKAVTSMSPLQFQKRLRLQEARQLMLSENLDAASAGHRVGYVDAAHFSREYKSLFGLPPMRDVERLREANSQSTLQAAVQST